MCPRKTFVIDVIIQELLIRRYWVPMKLDAVGLIANVENLKNKSLVPNVDREQTSYDDLLDGLSFHQNFSVRYKARHLALLNAEGNFEGYQI